MIFGVSWTSATEPGNVIKKSKLFSIEVDFYSTVAHFGELLAVYKAKEVENFYVSGYLKV